MHNAPHDLRDYVLDELDPAQRAAVEAWLSTSPEGRKEVERLGLTFSALRSLPDEEPPRRIAFISDKIFEPSPWVRLLRWFQAEGPRLALGTAAVLAVLFTGVWATEPTVTASADGWTMAFGAQSNPIASAPIAKPPALDEAALQAKVDEAVAAERERMLEAIQQTLTPVIEKRVRTAEVKFSAELAATQQDVESSLYMTNGKLEQLLKQLAEPEVAVAQ